jgi:hypothetical protein
MSEVALPVLPRMQRIHLKVILGTIKALQAEMGDLTPELKQSCFDSGAFDKLAEWRQNVETTYVGSVDEPAAPRVTTTAAE